MFGPWNCTWTTDSAASGEIGDVLRWSWARVDDWNARRDFKPQQEPLTDPLDEGILVFDAPGRSWEYAIWEMSD